MDIKRFFAGTGSVGLLALVVSLATAAPAHAQDEEIPLGTSLPMATTSLETTQGARTLADLGGPGGTVVLFWSNQCTWTNKYEDRVRALMGDFGDQVGFVLVNANDAAAFPQESAEQNAAQNWRVPYVTDAGSRLARAFGASRAPHVFVFDADRTLVYTGSIDDSPGDPGSVRQAYVQNALEALAQGRAVEVPKTKAFGCMIKFYE